MHESTLNGTAVENWLKLCVGLVNFAQVEMRVIAPILLGSIVDDELDIAQVLKIIGLPPQMLYYATKLQTLKATEKGRIEVEGNEMKIATDSRYDITVGGIGGCTGMFIWTSNPEKLICVHADPEPDNVENFVRLSAQEAHAQGSTPRAVTIVSPVEEDLERVEAEFKLVFPTIRPRTHLYPSDEVVAKKEGVWDLVGTAEDPEVPVWDFDGNVATPGEIVKRYEWYGAAVRTKNGRGGIWEDTR